MPMKTLKMAALAVAAASLAGLALAGSAQAEETLKAKLTGAAEKPAGDPKGAGSATVKVDTAKNQVCYELKVEGLTGTMAHIHKGAADASGPVAVPLTAPDAAGKSQGCATADAAVVKDIAANPGGYYVNVHSAAFPGGAIRGQLTK
jgi:hypothetical protein